MTRTGSSLVHNCPSTAPVNPLAVRSWPNAILLCGMGLLVLAFSSIPVARSVNAPSADSTSSVDLSITGLDLTQGVSGEPLVLGKETVARVGIALPAGAASNAALHLDVDGKGYDQAVSLASPGMTVTLKIDAPREVKPIVATATVSPTSQATDPNPQDNSRTITDQTVQTTQKVVAFFLPVDWTPEARSQYDYDESFKRYVQDAGDFLIGTYPLPADQVIVDYTMTPDMLNPFEKELTDSEGKFNMRNALALYASLSIAGRRYRSDATMVVGVLPPGWFRQNGQPGTLGLTLSNVKGIVTAQYGGDMPPIVASHEIGHLFALDEDYDFAVKPNRPCLAIPTPGYWAQRDEELAASASHPLCTFMSAASSQDTYWEDQRLYEYLMAKFAVNGGAASSPLVLAATPASKVESDGSPGPTSANVRRFEPNQAIYLSVAGISLNAGSSLGAKLYRGNTLMRELKPQTTKVGNGWYAFTVSSGRGMPEDTYRVDVTLDGQLVKSDSIEVRASQ